jgi:hypothetical protein
VDAFKFMLPAIRQVNDPIERAVVAAEAADFLGVDRDVLRDHFRRGSAAEPRTTAKQIPPAVPPNERLLLACLLSSEGAREIMREFMRERDVLALLELRSIFEAWLQLEDESAPFSFDALIGRLEPRLARILTGFSFSDAGITPEDAEQQALHCLHALEKKSVDAARTRLRHRIRELEQNGKLAEALRLTHELNLTNKASSGG